MSVLRIYIAGPYSADTSEEREENVARAIDAALQLIRKGHTPFIPHLTHYVDLRAALLGETFTWQDYLTWDLSWLELCDALLFLASSPGAELERDRAKALGKLIFTSVDEIPSAAELDG
jgi:hypothetical protein